MTSDAKLEREKHRLTLALEAEKWAYKKQELVFIEAGQHIRALNVTLWQVPSMAIAITGGLWYGISLFDHATVKIAALLFTSLVDLVTIRIIWRLRSVMSDYLVAQLSFQSQSGPDKPKHIVMWCWSAILFSAALLGVLGALNVTTLARESANSKPAITSCETALALDISLEAARSRSVTSRKPLKNLQHKQCQ